MMATKQMMRYLNEQERVVRPLRYDVRQDRITAEVAARYVASHCDDGTKEYFRQFCHQSEGCWATFKLNSLRLFYSVTDSNAILGRGQMHVLSEAQLAALLQAAAHDSTDAIMRDACSMLDIGSGDGNVTDKVARIVAASQAMRQAGDADESWRSLVTTTEVSKYMVKRLRQIGYRCLEVMTLERQVLAEEMQRLGAPLDTCGPAFKVVACFNVIDRCDTPLTLLRQCRQLLLPVGHKVDQPVPEDCGVLLLAVVLPWNAFVEDGASQKQPSERLPVRGPNVIWAKEAERFREEQKRMRLSQQQLNHMPECTQGGATQRKRNVTSGAWREVTSQKQVKCACCCSFEEAAEWMIHNVLEPLHFEVLSWTRVPYISAGDMNAEYYTLDNAVFVLRPVAAT